MRRDILEALGKSVVDGPPLNQGPSSVLAVDRVSRWAAAFVAEVDEQLVLYTQIVIMQRSRLAGASWDELGSGGGRRQLERVPWVPGIDRSPSSLLITDTVSRDVEDDDEMESRILAVAGFGVGEVNAIRVEQDSGSRTVALVGPLRSFTVIAAGDSSFSIEPLLGESGAPGPSEYFEISD